MRTFKFLIMIAIVEISLTGLLFNSLAAQPAFERVGAEATLNQSAENLVSMITARATTKDHTLVRVSGLEGLKEARRVDLPINSRF
jgi:hypothetical protein